MKPHIKLKLEDLSGIYEHGLVNISRFIVSRTDDNQYVFQRLRPTNDGYTHKGDSIVADAVGVKRAIVAFNATKISSAIQ